MARGDFPSILGINHPNFLWLVGFLSFCLPVSIDQMECSRRHYGGFTRIGQERIGGIGESKNNKNVLLAKCQLFAR